MAALDAEPPADLDRGVDHLLRHFGCVHFRHGGLARDALSPHVTHPGGAVGEQRRGFDAGGHIGDLRLRHLEIGERLDRKSTRLNSSHLVISYAVFCLKKKKYTEYTA